MSLTITTTRVIGAKEKLQFTDPYGVIINQVTGQPAPSLTNNGLITVTSAGIWGKLAGIMMGDGGSFEGSLFFNSATGTLRVVGTSAASTAYGFYGGGPSSDVTNAGLIEVIGQGAAIGVYSPDDINFSNTGTLRVRSQDYATGVVFSQGAAFSNSQLIDVQGVTGAIGFALQGDARGPIVNTGSILVSDSNAAEASIGVLIRDRAVLNNSGLIRAEVAVGVIDGLFDYTTWSGQTVNNSGTLDGEVWLDTGDDQLINSGSIAGLVDLGAGNDLFDGVAGTASRAIYGEEGDDTLRGGVGREILYGGLGSDTIHGGGGNDFIDGGRGNDDLNGGEGFDTLSYAAATVGVSVNLGTGQGSATGIDVVSGFERVIGGSLDDTLVGSSAGDTLEGRDGHDIVDGAGGADTLVGGRGADRLSGGAGNDLFVFAVGDGADRITDFQAGGVEDSLQIWGYGAYQTIQQTAEGALVVLSATDSILLVGVQAGSLTAADFSFNTGPYQGGAADPAAEPRIDATTIVIHDPFLVYEGERLHVAGQPVGIYIEGLRSLSNSLPTGIENRGHLTLDLASASGNLIGIEVAYGTMGTATSGYSLKNAAGASVIIDGTPTPGNLLFGFYTGDNANAFDNAGLFQVTAHGFGEAIGFASYDSDQSFLNTGQILVFAERGGAHGVRFQNGGVFTNSGVIKAVSAQGGASGVFLGNAFSAFNNSGTIEASGTALFVDELRYGSALKNSGLISSANVAIFSRAAVVVENTGVIKGRVELSNQADRLVSRGAIDGQVYLGSGADVFDGREAVTAFMINAGDGDDSVDGGDGADTLDGEGGDDLMLGGAGDDLMSGWSGIDRLHGGDGDDRLYADNRYTDVEFSSGENYLFGGAGNDLLFSSGGSDELDGGAGDDTLRGGDGADWAVFASAVAGVTVDLAITTAQDTGEGLDTLTGIENLRGGQFDDVLAGDARDNVLEGGDGADRLIGKGGGDLLRGGRGGDVFVFAAGSGSDTIADFEIGYDYIDASAFGSVQSEVQSGADTVVTFSAGDSVRLLGIQAGQLTPSSIYVSGPLPPPPPAARAAASTSAAPGAAADPGGDRHRAGLVRPTGRDLDHRHPDWRVGPRCLARRGGRRHPEGWREP